MLMSFAVKVEAAPV